MNKQLISTSVCCQLLLHHSLDSKTTVLTLGYLESLNCGSCSTYVANKCHLLCYSGHLLTVHIISRYVDRQL